jgi:hypothetical protein
VDIWASVPEAAGMITITVLALAAEWLLTVAEGRLLDGKMKSEGAKNVLAVLSLANATVKAKKATIDFSKTYTTEFADNAK